MLAAALGLVFVFLLTGHWTTALVFAGAVAAALAAWHWTEADAQPATPRRLAMPSGWWGMATFLATEAALFGSLIGTYFYLRFTSPDWPQGGIDAPSAALPVALTILLVATSAPMAVAAGAARRGQARVAWAAVALAFLVQAGYLAVQIVQYIHEIGTFAPDTNAYSSIYFTLLGAHHAHVAAGLLLDVWLLVRLLGGLTHYRVVAVRSVALYWYVVNAIAIFVVATQMSPS